MKVIWIHNYSYLDYIGGAELTDNYWIDKARKLGIDITEVTHQTKNPPDKADFFILGNISKLDSAYIRAVTHMSYASAFHGGLVDEEHLEIMNNSRVTILMSPAQREKYKCFLNRTKIYLSPPYIDPSLFRNYQRKREPNSFLYIGAIREHKGIPLIINYAKRYINSHFYFYGPTKDKERYLTDAINKHTNCHYMGLLKYKKIPNVMNQYENFIWFLNPKINNFESFGRTVAEALLCEMHLKVKRNQFGFFSWQWNFDDRNEVASKIQEHYDNFWVDILKYL